jgi:hypothetical protein
MSVTTTHIHSAFLWNPLNVESGFKQKVSLNKIAAAVNKSTTGTPAEIPNCEIMKTLMSLMDEGHVVDYGNEKYNLTIKGQAHIMNIADAA